MLIFLCLEYSTFCGKNQLGHVELIETRCIPKKTFHIFEGVVPLMVVANQMFLAHCPPFKKSAYAPGVCKCSCLLTTYYSQLKYV